MNSVSMPSPKSPTLKHSSISSPKFDPYNPEERQKPMRTVPRKLSELNSEELTSVHSWYSSKPKQGKDFQPTSNKMRDLALSPEDIAKLRSKEYMEFRRIYFSTIPDEEKPDYEQEETEQACASLMDMMELRDKYIFYDKCLHQNPLLNYVRGEGRAPNYTELAEDDLTYEVIEGVFTLKREESVVNVGVVSRSEYYSDLYILQKAIHNAANKSFCYKRLKLLQMKFDIHLMCNAERESLQQQAMAKKDFYNTVKVDNHVHLSAAMNQKHLQKFIKKKLTTEPEVIVRKNGDQLKTLKQVFEELGITCPTHLSSEMLNCYADHKTFHRFDRFNAKYSPLGQPVLREIFLKTDNHIEGRYFAEVTKEVINNLESGKYIMAEYRVSIYGKNYQEWEKLASWFTSFSLKSKCVKWLIQIPRLYSIYKRAGSIDNFQEMLVNIFGPLFDATLNPEKYPRISQMLEEVVGFDSVDDESLMEKVKSLTNYKKVSPGDWNVTDNPPYSYWVYYIYSNLYVLNHLRRAKGMNTFAFRPHCGEAGSHDHLATAFLTAHSINHGIELRNIPVLQYLFYLKQIGLSVSPLSNNKLFLKFLMNPFPKFFARGLNVTLSTDDPLMIHLTKEPLIEEYSVMMQAMNMSMVDLCEIARNSVLQSGFGLEDKKRWLGDNFMEGTPESHDVKRSNLSAVRFCYRWEAYQEELSYIFKHSDKNESIPRISI